MAFCESNCLLLLPRNIIYLKIKITYPYLRTWATLLSATDLKVKDFRTVDPYKGSRVHEYPMTSWLSTRVVSCLLRSLWSMGGSTSSQTKWSSLEKKCPPPLTNLHIHLSHNINLSHPPAYSLLHPLLGNLPGLHHTNCEQCCISIWPNKIQVSTWINLLIFLLSYHDKSNVTVLDLLLFRAAGIVGFPWDIYFAQAKTTFQIFRQDFQIENEISTTQVSILINLL